jgi:hypothetical protein
MKDQRRGKRLQPLERLERFELLERLELIAAIRPLFFRHQNLPEFAHQVRIDLIQFARNAFDFRPC